MKATIKQPSVRRARAKATIKQPSAGVTRMENTQSLVRVLTQALSVAAYPESKAVIERAIREIQGIE